MNLKKVVIICCEKDCFDCHVKYEEISRVPTGYYLPNHLCSSCELDLFKLMKHQLFHNSLESIVYVKCDKSHFSGELK